MRLRFSWRGGRCCVLWLDHGASLHAQVLARFMTQLGSPQAVCALGVFGFQPADPGQGATTIGDGDGDEDFIGAGGIVDADFNAVEMRANIGRIFMAEGDIEDLSGTAHFFGGGHQSRAFFDFLAQRGTHFGMKQGGGVFQLAILANHRRFAVAFGLGGGDPKCLNAFAAKQRAKLCADFDQRREIFDIAPGERIGDDSTGHGLAGGRRDGLADLPVGFFNGDNDFADFNARHGAGTFPLRRRCYGAD